MTKGYKVRHYPAPEDMWILPQIQDGDAYFIGEEVTFPDNLPRGPDYLIAFNVDTLAYVEAFHTRLCPCGETVFVTDEELEAHL